MTFTIGPVGITGASDAITDPRTISSDGERITLTGKYFGTVAAERTAMRDQLRGLIEPGMNRIVPVTWTTDPTIDGYYNIAGIDLDLDPMAYQSDGWHDYKIDLERLPGGNALPGIESILQGGYRPNQVSVANVAHGENSLAATYLQPEWAIPSSALELEIMNPSLGSPAYDVRMVRQFKSGYWTRSIRWAVPAAGYYTGACQIEQQIGARWMTVVGRSPVITDTSKIRISNGYMGLTFRHPSVATEFGMQFAGFGRTAGVLDWTTKSTFMRLGNSGAASGATVNAITILRNDPEEVRLRFSIVGSSSLQSWIYVDISLRRGLDYVTVSYPGGIGVGQATVCFDATANVASTTTTEGLFRTATTGGVQPWVLTTGGSASVVKDTTVGSIVVSNAGGFVSFGVGPVYDSTAPASSYTGSKTRWYAPLTERQRIVGR